MAVAKNEIGLTDEERLELASYLLRRDVASWKELDDGQILRLLDALEGWHLVGQLLALRPEDRRDAVVRELDGGQDSGCHMVFDGVGAGESMFVAPE